MKSCSSPYAMRYTNTMLRLPFMLLTDLPLIGSKRNHDSSATAGIHNQRRFRIDHPDQHRLQPLRDGVHGGLLQSRYHASYKHGRVRGHGPDRHQRRHGSHDRDLHTFSSKTRSDLLQLLSRYYSFLCSRTYIFYFFFFCFALETKRSLLLFLLKAMTSSSMSTNVISYFLSIFSSTWQMMKL